MIPFMALMIGAYIVTRMTVYLLDNDPNQPSRFGLVINKLFAAGTIAIAVICILLIFASGIDLNQYLK